MQRSASNHGIENPYAQNQVWRSGTYLSVSPRKKDSILSRRRGGTLSMKQERKLEAKFRTAGRCKQAASHETDLQYIVERRVSPCLATAIALERQENIPSFILIPVVSPHNTTNELNHLALAWFAQSTNYQTRNLPPFPSKTEKNKQRFDRLRAQQVVRVPWLYHNVIGARFSIFEMNYFRTQTTRRDAVPAIRRCGRYN